MKISSITDSVTADGLRLAGVAEVYESEDPKDAEEDFKSILDGEDVGMIILTEKLAQGMSESVLNSAREAEGITPIVVEIPGKEGPIPERREVIDRLVKRAVGIKVEG